MTPTARLFPIYQPWWMPQIGAASGLDSIEGNLALWLDDASNINYKQNAGINDGDAIAEWKDLSGNGNHGV